MLLKFFLNSNTKSYLRNLETEFGESTNAIRLELNKFEHSGMLISEFEGNKKFYKANIKHPLFSNINSIILKYTGIDWIVEYLVKQLGKVEKIYLIGSFAKGISSDCIELLFVGEINQVFLNDLCLKIEKKLEKRIKYEIVDTKYIVDNLSKISYENYLLLWEC